MPRDLIEFPEVVVQPQVPALLPIGHQRLLRLAEFLETVPSDRLRMSGWSTAHESLLDECGTSACAAGWADIIPEFRAAGYSCKSQHGPIYGEKEGFAALRAFFELDYESSWHLFFALEYPDPDSIAPSDVTARIREFVAARRSA